MFNWVGSGEGAWSREHRLVSWVVICYAAATMIIVSSSRCAGRAAEAAGLFPLGILLDSWGAAFASLLGLISCSVYLWSFYYMDSTPYYRRFLGVLTLFVGAMASLIWSSSLYLTLVGWDTLGITSFFLVIYFENRKALGSGLITALTNRVGDAVFMILLGVSLGHTGSFSHWQIICVLVLAMTKSAQYPFSSWLPAAMAAPTPVSALVHSSTLVTAGIYVLLRYNPHEFEWLLLVGSVTMLMAGICACAEMDLKKIVALSTLSQLGVMVVAIGLELKVLCFFHLMTHALFKALLFLCVGMYIHNTFGGQDYRSFAALASGSRGGSVLASLACLSLLGFPFLAGFFSKDLILEGTYNRGVACQSLVWLLVGVGLTTAYSVKMLGLVLPRGGTAGSSTVAGGGWGGTCKVPTILMGIGAAFGGTIGGVWATPVVAGGLDKMMPLIFLLCGIGLSLAVRGLRLGYFSSMWGLTPALQRTSSAARAAGAVRALDQGSWALAGGPGATAWAQRASVTAVGWLVAAGACSFSLV